jgi:hypothetical protein
MINVEQKPDSKLPPGSRFCGGAQECGQLLGSLETERETGVAGLVLRTGSQKTAQRAWRSSQKGALAFRRIWMLRGVKTLCDSPGALLSGRLWGERG